MNYVKTVQLKTLEEVLKVKGVSKVDSGIILFEGTTLKEWLNPEELHILGKEVDAYVDEYDVMYDLILKDVEYDEDSMDAIYALTSYEWLVKED